MGARVALISQTRITTVTRHRAPAFVWQAGRTAGHVEGCLRGLGRSGAANPAFQRNTMSSAQYYCAHSSPSQLRHDALPQPLLDRAVPTVRSGVRISPFSHAMCGDGQPSRVIAEGTNTGSAPPSQPEVPAKELLSRRLFSALACASGVGDKSIYRQVISPPLPESSKGVDGDQTPIRPNLGRFENPSYVADDVCRATLDERLLRIDPAYRESMRRVRWRLFPGVY
jgi:hypothetical protein